MPISTHYERNKTFTLQDTRANRLMDGEVRLSVAYCGICGTDLHIYHGSMDKRVPEAAIIGHEASAVISEVGPGVSGFSIGDKVVVRPLDNRGETGADRGISHICSGLKFIGIDSPGAFQESWTVPAFTLHKVPGDIDLKLAALAEPLAVACHDVNRANLKKNELAVVIGGGPIGLLVALVARHHGAQVIISEVNPERITFAKEQLGLDAINPMDTDLSAVCRERSGGSGADVVFEVSGAKAAALAMTEPLALRGRIVLVAVHPQPVEVNLFHFFWKELSLIGARVYEPEDYEEALQLLAANSLPLDKFITATFPLEKIQTAFESCDKQETGIKTLIDCRPERIQ